MSKRSRQGRARTSRSVRRLVLPGLIGAAAVAAAVILVFGGRGGSKGPGAAQAAPGAAQAARHVLGLSSAPVVLAEYGDFQCTSCGAFFRSVEPQIKAAYIDTGRIRFEWHDFAWIGQESLDAANAARCAGDQGKFWELHDLLYGSQSGENQGAFAKARLKAMGVQLGLEPVVYNACVDGNTHAAAVQADLSDVQNKGFNSTPTFLLAGQRIVGAQPFAIFKSAIDGALGAK